MTPEDLTAFAHILTIAGSCGMIYFATRGFSSKPKVDDPPGYVVWCLSWGAILVAAVLHLLVL